MGAKSLEKVKKIHITEIVELDDDIEERGRTVIVKKAGLGKYKKLSDIIRNLFEMLPNILEEKGIEDPDEYIEDLEVTELIMMIPDLLMYSIDQLIELICLGTDVEKEFAEKHIGADEAFEILEAIIEVNGLLKVVEKGKNLLNRLGLMKMVSFQGKKMMAQNMNNMKGRPNQETKATRKETQTKDSTA